MNTINKFFKIFFVKFSKMSKKIKNLKKIFFKKMFKILKNFGEPQKSQNLEKDVDPCTRRQNHCFGIFKNLFEKITF